MIEISWLQLYLFINAVLTLFNFIMIWLIITKMGSSVKLIDEMYKIFQEYKRRIKEDRK